MPPKPTAGRILLASVALVLERGGKLTRALILPGILLVITQGIEKQLLDDDMRFVMQFPHLMVYTWIALITHRITLLGVDSVPEWGISGWSPREMRYFVTMLAVLIVSFMIFVPGALLQPVGPVIAMLIIVLVAGRLSLMFPAIALDKPANFHSAWMASRGHTRLLVIIAVILPLMVSAPSYLVHWIDGPFWLAAILEIPTSAFALVCLSLAYSEIVKHPVGA